MKAALLVILAVMGVSSLRAEDVVIRAFPATKSLSYRGEILKQAILEKKNGHHMPYMMAGVRPKEEVLKSGDLSKGLPQTGSKITLPDGGIAQVTITRKELDEGVWQFDSKIDVTRPGAGDTQMTLTSYDGDGILICCQGNKRPEIVFIQISKG